MLLSYRALQTGALNSSKNVFARLCFTYCAHSRRLKTVTVTSRYYQNVSHCVAMSFPSFVSGLSGYVCPFLLEIWLNTLCSFQVHWEQHGSRLVSKTVEKLHLLPKRQDEGPSSQGCPKPVAPFDLCRLHQLFSGASFMARYTPSWLPNPPCKQCFNLQ